MDENLEKMAKPDNRMSTKGLEYGITAIIALVFFLVPLFFMGVAAQGLGFEKLVLFYFLVLLGAVAWVFKGLIDGELTLKRTPLDLPILAFLSVYVVSTILSINPKDSLIGPYGSPVKGLAAVIVIILFYYLVVNNLDAKRLKFCIWAFLGSAVLMVPFALLQITGRFLLPMDFTKLTNFNPIGSPSGLTMYLTMILPLLIVAAAQVKEMQPNWGKGKEYAAKIILGLVAAGALAIMALLNGFVFWPASIVSLAIVLMFFLPKVIRITTNNLVIPVVSFLLVIILLVLGNFNIMDLKLPAEVSLSRNASFNIAKQSLAEDPVFGTGPGTFYYSFTKFKSADFNRSPLWNVRFDSASGFVFEMVSSIGILGALSFVIMLLIAISISFIALMKSDKKELHSPILGLFSGMLAILIVASLFTVNNAFILVVAVYGVLVMAAALVSYPEDWKSLKLSFRASPKYALALAAIFLCVSGGVVIMFTMGLKMFLGDYYARQSLDVSTPEEKIRLLDKAIQLAPYQDVYYLNQANQYMALANQSALNTGDQAAVQQNLAQAIERGKRGYEIGPMRAANSESLGLIYENASFYTRGALEWAEKYYNEVAALDPTNPIPYLRIALINMARANAETDQTEKEFYINEAIKKYDESLSKKDDLAAAYYGKAIASEKLNKLDDAIEQLKNANIVSRNNIDYLFELGRLYFNRGVTQPNLDQTATKQITENAVTPEGEQVPQDGLSVDKQGTGAVTSRNDDINIAETIFASIVNANSNHANARYSLAVLYQKIGDTAKVREQVNALLEIIQDEQTKNLVRQQFQGLF